MSLVSHTAYVTTWLSRSRGTRLPILSAIVVTAHAQVLILPLTTSDNGLSFTVFASEPEFSHKVPTAKTAENEPNSYHQGRPSLNRSAVFLRSIMCGGGGVTKQQQNIVPTTTTVMTSVYAANAKCQTLIRPARPG